MVAFFSWLIIIVLFLLLMSLLRRPLVTFPSVESAGGLLLQHNGVRDQGSFCLLCFDDRFRKEITVALSRLWRDSIDSNIVFFLGLGRKWVFKLSIFLKATVEGRHL